MPDVPTPTDLAYQLQRQQQAFAATHALVAAARAVIAQWDPATGRPAAFVQALAALRDALRTYDYWTPPRGEEDPPHA